MPLIAQSVGLWSPLDDLHVFFPNLTRFSWLVGSYEQTTEVSLLAAGSGWRRSSTRAST